MEEQTNTQRIEELCLANGWDYIPTLLNIANDQGHDWQIEAEMFLDDATIPKRDLETLAEEHAVKKSSRPLRAGPGLRLN